MNKPETIDYLVTGFKKSVEQVEPDFKFEDIYFTGNLNLFDFPKYPQSDPSFVTLVSGSQEYTENGMENKLSMQSFINNHQAINNHIGWMQAARKWFGHKASPEFILSRVMRDMDLLSIMAGTDNDFSVQGVLEQRYEEDDSGEYYRVAPVLFIDKESLDITRQWQEKYGKIYDPVKSDELIILSDSH